MCTGSLAQALTGKTERLCAGLAMDEADILELVTPTTALLLRWWFGNTACRERRVNFRACQRQAILNVIVAHEVLGARNLRALYELVAPELLSSGERLLEIIRPRYFHPTYCIGAAVGSGGLLVLQALLIWQLLNKTCALQNGRDDSRFTRRFLLVAPHADARDRLRGSFGDGSSIAGMSVAARVALLMPAAQREYLLDFWRTHLCDAASLTRCRSAAGLIAIATRSVEPSADALGSFMSLPDLMLFDELSVAGEVESGWQKTLARMTANKGRRFFQVDFLAGRRRALEEFCQPVHVVADLRALEGD